MKRTISHSGSLGFSLVEVLIVVTLVGILTVMAIPMFSSITRSLRADGDLRSMYGDTGLAKMRAASDFTKVRLRANTSAATFQLELWNKTGNSWDVFNSVQSLSQGMSFGYGTLATPPSSTQTSIGQAPICKDSSNNDIANTSCIIFNSRGIPVDNGGTPTGEDALYMTDGVSVQAVTVSATGFARSWRSGIASASWKAR